MAIEENQAKRAKITEEGATKRSIKKVPTTVKQVELEDEDGTIICFCV